MVTICFFCPLVACVIIITSGIIYSKSNIQSNKLCSNIITYSSQWFITSGYILAYFLSDLPECLKYCFCAYVAFHILLSLYCYRLKR